MAAEAKKRAEPRTGAQETSTPEASRHLSSAEKDFLRFVLLAALGPDESAYEFRDLAHAIDATLRDVILWNGDAFPFWYALDPEVALAAMALVFGGADAITLGSDIYFRETTFPAPEADLGLVGHEVYHALHVKLMGLGEIPWLVGYGTDSLLVGLRGRNAYRGNLSEVYAYAIQATIDEILGNHKGLVDAIAKRTVNAKFPNIRKEIRAAFLRHLKEEFENRRR